VFLILQRELTAKTPKEFNNDFLKTALSAALHAHAKTASKKPATFPIGMFAAALGIQLQVQADREGRTRRGSTHCSQTMSI
jgi:hypothetical protein